jgi:hypothetical protein
VRALRRRLAGEGDLPAARGRSAAPSLHPAGGAIAAQTATRAGL